MPIETQLDIAPYHDDHDPTKDFVRILFKPESAVQVRELNQLSTLVQEQFERFGNNIFKRGTIVSGCTFTFIPNYPYVKLLDNQSDGQPVSIAGYQGLFLRNSANVVAYVVNQEDGFESTDPDLKTVYLQYINAGNDGNSFTFAAGQSLTAFDSNNGVWSVSIGNGGSGFTNSDSIEFVSAVAVNVSSGTFQNNEVVNQAGTGAKARVVEVNTTANTEYTILRLRPITTDLSNTSGNSAAWTLSVSGEANTISGNTSGAVAEVVGVVGSGAAAELLTDGSGRVILVSTTDRGEGYYVPPFTVVKSLNANANITDLSLTAANYKSQVTIASVANSVGSGYAMAVGDGVIYQKGYALRVAPQVVIVEKYNRYPNAVSVGFRTIEDIVDANEDPSLLDNVLDPDASLSPGADRLRMRPELIVVETADALANQEFFSLVDFSEGTPYKQNQRTVYNAIGDDMAQRGSELDGDVVLDRFLVTTRSPLDANVEANTFSVVVDPGTAYISGYRVQTRTNFVTDVEKGIDTNLREDMRVSLNYGNYVIVKELAGTFQFSTADTIDLYDTASGFLSNTAAVAAGTISATGTKIGTARVRSLVPNSGDVGVPSTTFRMYIFDVQMNSGASFDLVRSVYYNGSSYKGIADVVTEVDGTTSDNVARIYYPNLDKLLFPTGSDSTKNANDVYYTYRTVDQSLAMANTGVLQISLAGSPSEFFPYSGNLTSSQTRDLVVVPVSKNLRASANLAGNVSVATNSSNAVGVSTTFLTDLKVGDYVYFYGNSSTSDVKRVTSVVNNTLITLNSNTSFTNTGALVYRVLPKNVPLPISTRSGFNANVDANGNILTISTGFALEGSTSANVSVSYNVERRNVTQSTKTPNRDLFVKISLANNADGVDGPWCIGVPDVFRLKNVYWANSSSVNTSSLDVTDQFFIDHNQNPSYLDLSWLYQRPQSKLALDSTYDWLLVKFDAFTSSTGFFDVVSYVSANSADRFATDSAQLSTLTSTINTLEIPEVFGKTGEYFDLINNFDFRPKVANTAALTSNAALATINPAYTVSFGNTADPANDRKFPLPDSVLTANVEEFVGRTDSVVVDVTGRVTVLRGVPVPGNDGVPPDRAANTMLLNDIVIPAYPSIPEFQSNSLYTIVSTSIANERYSNLRFRNHAIRRPLTESQIETNQPTAYSHADVGNIDRRLRDVEYYVALTLLESQLRDRVIPSSISNAINRAKFGFFVDDYESLQFSDIDDPEWSAEVEDGILHCEQEMIAINHGNTHVCEYENFAVITQSNATDATGAVPTQGTQRVNRRAANRKKVGDGTAAKYYTDVLSVTMSSTSGNVSIYMYMYSDYDRLTVKQGNTTIATCADAVPLTNNDIRYLHTNDHFQGISSDMFRKQDIGTGANAGFMKHGGKIQFVHSPAGGREYTVTTDKGRSSNDWRYSIEYPVDGAGNISNTQPNTAPMTPPEFVGHIDVNPEGFFNYFREDRPKQGKSNRPSVYCKAYGLKANTKHSLFVQYDDHTSDCEQIDETPRTVNDANYICSDAKGQATFRFYYDEDEYVLVRDHDKKKQKTRQKSLGLKLRSVDGSSYAKGNMPMTYVEY